MIIAYDQAYYESHYRHLMVDSKYKAMAQFQRLNYFGAIPDDTSIFEVGLGLGANVAWSSSAAGTDMSEYARIYCQHKGIKTYECLEDAPAETYEIVLCNHVLEHTEYPLDILRQMKRLCRPGGKIFVIVPKERHGRSTFAPDNEAHLYAWTFRTLNNLFLQTEIKIVENRNVFGPTGLSMLGASAGRPASWRLKLVKTIGALKGVLPGLLVAGQKPDK